RAGPGGSLATSATPTSKGGSCNGELETLLLPRCAFPVFPRFSPVDFPPGNLKLLKQWTLEQMPLPPPGKAPGPDIDGGRSLTLRVGHGRSARLGESGYVGRPAVMGRKSSPDNLFGMEEFGGGKVPPKKAFFPCRGGPGAVRIPLTCRLLFSHFEWRPSDV